MNFSIRSKKLFFDHWQPVRDGDQFFILNDPQTDPVEKILVYTKKSLRRESKNLNEKLDKNFRAGSKLFWVAPFHEQIFLSLNSEQKRGFFWLSCSDFSVKKTQQEYRFRSENSCIIFNIETLRYVLQSIQKDDLVRIEFHPALRNSNIFQELQESLEALMRQVALRLKTIRNFKNIWAYNFRVNYERWERCHSISEIKLQKPDYFILGGPSVTRFLEELDDRKKIIWAADTSWMPLIHKGISPELIFSIDAGYGSYEHFIYHATKIRKNQTKLLLDPLSFPKFYITGMKIYSYANSNPLVQQAIQKKNPFLEKKFPVLSNDTGDVYGIMQSFFSYLFPGSKFPRVIGHDQSARRSETHLRGSGYHERRYNRSNRLETTENYFFEFSHRY